MADLFHTYTSAAEMTGALTPAFTPSGRRCWIAKGNAGTQIALAGGCVR